MSHCIAHKFCLLSRRGCSAARVTFSCGHHRHGQSAVCRVLAQSLPHSVETTDDVEDGGGGGLSGISDSVQFSLSNGKLQTRGRRRSSRRSLPVWGCLILSPSSRVCRLGRNLMGSWEGGEEEENEDFRLKSSSLEEG